MSNRIWPFRPLRRLTTAVIALLILQVSCSILITLTDVIGTLIIPTWHSQDAPLEGGAHLAMLALLVLGGIATLLLLIATAIVFLVWLYRASANARALGGIDLKITPGWAVGWWFIPFANLVKPYQAVREIYVTSHDLVGRDVAASSLIGVWWACWIINNILGQVSMRMALRGDESLVAMSTWLDAVGLVFHVAAAWLLIRITCEITRAQQEAGSAAPAIARAGDCLRCGYDLRGTPGIACPECGQPLPA